MASITLDRVTKVYPSGMVAVRDLELAVNDGELVVLVGPSGCGKSTTLRLIAGLETPTTGRILLDSRDVTDVPPQERDLAMVFQSYALYPHKTVRQNLAFGLRMRRMTRQQIEPRIDRVAHALGIEDLLDRKPAQLSGGQRQRVALGRALVREPRAFLLDEPLSNLDPRLRVQARTELTLLHRRVGATMVHVTHDQEEAMTLGDRIAVMHEGRIQQLATPRDVYGRPANAFVASFIGSPEINLFRCRLRAADSSLRLASAAFTLQFDGARGLDGDDAPLAAFRRAVGQLGIDSGYGIAAEILLGVRPHDLNLAPVDQADANGIVQLVEMLGSALLVHVRLGAGEDQTVRIITATDSTVQVEERVGIRFNRRALHLFRAADGERLG